MGHDFHLKLNSNSDLLLPQDLKYSAMYIALHYYYQSLSNTKKEMTWKQQENIAYDTKIRYSWWITVAGQAFWYQVSRLSNTFFRPIFRLEFLKNSGVTCFFRAGILEEFSRQNTYELLLSANGYIFDGNSDQLEFMKNSRVICFFSQGNRAYGTKIRYLW